MVSLADCVCSLVKKHLQELSWLDKASTSSKNMHWVCYLELVVEFCIFGTEKVTSKKKLTKFGYIRSFAATVHKNCTSSLSDGAAWI